MATDRSLTPQEGGLLPGTGEADTPSFPDFPEAEQRRGKLLVEVTQAEGPPIDLERWADQYVSWVSEHLEEILPIHLRQKERV